MGKRLGLKVSGRYREVAAIRRWPYLEVRLYIYCYIDINMVEENESISEWAHLFKLSQPFAIL